jgi:hypothetical protein
MANGLVGLFALYFIFVGIKGNAKTLANNAQSDGREFMVWILAIIILRAMYQSEKARPVVGAFSALVLTSFFIMNYKTVASELNKITGRDFFKV